MRMILLAGLAIVVGAAAVRAEAPPERSETVEFDLEADGWVNKPAPEAGTPAGDLQLARKQYVQKQYRRARRAAQAWQKEYGEEHTLGAETVLLECAARIGEREYYKAHKRLLEFLSTYAGTQYEEKALTMEFVVAEVFLRGTKRKWLGMRILKADDLALAILDDLVANYPASRLAELATLTKANHYYTAGDFAFAEFEYAYLVENFPQSRYTRSAMLQSARSALAAFPGIDFDDAPLIEAEERFNRYLARYPGTAEQEGIGLILEDIAETRAAKELAVGKYYQKTGKLRAARFYYRSTMTHWPETIAARQAGERLSDLGGGAEPETADAAA